MTCSLMGIGIEFSSFLPYLLMRYISFLGPSFNLANNIMIKLIKTMLLLCCLHIGLLHYEII